MGQNIALSKVAGTKVNFEKPKDIVDRMIGRCYDEYQIANMADIHKLTRIKTSQG